MSKTKDRDLVSEYILYTIEETLEYSPHYLLAALNTRLSRTDPDPRLAHIKQLKAEIDSKIRELLDEADLSKLKNAGAKQKLVSDIYGTIDSTQRDKFNADLKENLEEIQKGELASVDTNLILSEVFTSKNDNYDDIKESKLMVSKVEPIVGINVEKFETDLASFDFTKYNSNKLMAFFEMINKYDFTVEFKDDDKNTFEGFLLILIYNNTQSINSFVFKKSFSEFTKKFTEKFRTAFESSLDSCNFVKASHLVLLCSYNPTLCVYLDKKGFIEQLVENFDQINIKDIHIYLKAFINIFTNYSYIVDKAVLFGICDNLAAKLLQTADIETISLFLTLLNKLSEFNVTPSKLFERTTRKLIIDKLLMIYLDVNEIKIWSYKVKNKPNTFVQESADDPVILLNQYCSTYREMIQQKSSIEKYQRLYYFSILLMKCLTRNVDLIGKKKVMPFVELVFDIMNVYFYQKSIIRHGYRALAKLASKDNIKFYMQEMFTTELLPNTFTVFERSVLNSKSIDGMLAVQEFMLKFIDCCQLANIRLSVHNLKQILDLVYKIKYAVNQFYYELKKKYLAKGLVKYIEKIKGEFKDTLVKPLDDVLSQNALILQRLSHTHQLEANVDVMMAPLKGTAIWDKTLKELRFEKPSESFYIANKVIYVVSKADRNEDYLDSVITFNLKMLDMVEDFVDQASKTNAHMPFDMVEQMIEYLIINIYFIKTYDEQYKKLTSIKALKKTVTLLTHIFVKAKNYTDLTSNHQIYILLENLSMFWFLFFDYKYKFYDRLSFIFIDNLKDLPREKNDNKEESFTNAVLHSLLNFLNDFVDLKSKCTYINFVIIKQIDVIHNTLTNISTINKNFMVNIIQKALSLNYNNDIHKLHPKYIVNYSVRIVSMSEIQSHFMNFIYRHKLFYNAFVYYMLRNSLSKNYDFSDIPDDETPNKELMICLIKKKDLPASGEITKYLFQLAQQSVNDKNLFQDILTLLKIHLRKVSSEYHAGLVKQMLNNTTLFTKLVRLYKKDKVNLSKVLKYFLLIAKHYSLYREINIPDKVISTMLAAKDLHKFQDVYIHLMNYIIENDKYATFKNEIDAFFVNVKKYLDGVLFFNKSVNVDGQIKSIYYFLKVLRNCSTLAPLTLNTNIEEFIIKFILQLFDENNKMELVPVNNLYQHFNQYFLTDQHNFKNLKYERKIVVTLLNLVKVDFPVASLIHDSFVVNKLISFCYYVVDEYPLEVYQNIYVELLQAGFNSGGGNMLFQDMFFDFYFLLYYSYSVQIDEMVPQVHDHIRQGLPFKEAFAKLLGSLKRKISRFDSLNYNLLIRDILVLYYIINDEVAQLDAQNHEDIVNTLNKIYKQYYKDIKKVSKLERLFVELYLFLNKTKAVKSNKSAAIFFNIFSAYSEFKFASLIDKYVYMGLFNNYIVKNNDKAKAVFTKDALEFHKDAAGKEEHKNKLAKIQLSKEKLEEVLKQLSIDVLSAGNEMVLLKFVKNCYIINKPAVTSLSFDQVMIEKKLAKIIESAKGFKTLSHVQLLVLKRRLDLINYAFAVSIATNTSDKQKVFELIQQLAVAFEELNKAGWTNPNMKPKLYMQFARRQAVALKRIYYFVSDQNESTLKVFLLNWLCSFIPVLDNKNLEDAGVVYRANEALYLGMKLISRKYDEVRVCQNDELVSKMLSLFKPEVLETVPEVIITKRERFEEVDETSKTYDFLKQGDAQSLIEFSVFIFTAFTKNKLLVDANIKAEIFTRIEANDLRFRHTELLRFLVSKLTQEYKENGMTFSVETKTDQPSSVPNSLVQKQGNILYVHKIFSTVWSNLQKNKNLESREEKYLKFGIQSLRLHLMENLDPEVFNKLNIFSILCDFFLSDDIPVGYKVDILGLMKTYVDKTGHKSGIKPENLKEFVYFYEKLLFDNFIELRVPYFEFLLNLMKMIEFNQEFVNTYFDKLNYALFETNNEISETVFVSSLELYTIILYKYKQSFDFIKVEELIYSFIKLNNKSLLLQERALFAIIISYLDMNLNIDQVKFNNMTLLLKFKHSNETLEQMFKTLQAIEVITDNYDRAQSFLKALNFELIFKLGIKSFGNSRKMIDLLSKLFLRYTYKIDENKFEMFETLKYLLFHIEIFYNIGDRTSVLMLYKCLINASILKRNAEYLINVDLSGIILRCFYKNDTEFFYLILSLLFNICYLFNTHEINIKDLITPEILHMISLTYDNCLEKKNDAILSQIIDLFLAFINHNNIQFFTLRLIKRMKLTLNFYYNNPAIIIKFLNIVKDLTVTSDTAVQDLLQTYFDPVYLYHIHFRNLGNAKINSLVKTIIFNLLRIRADTKGEGDLITYGIPENIVHTFSLEDDENTMIVNLNIIIFSLKFDKPVSFIRSQFVGTLKSILFSEYVNFSESIDYLCLEVLHSLCQYYGDVEMLNTNLYFDNVPKLCKLVMLFKDTEKYLYVLLKVIRNLIENDKEVLDRFDPVSKEILTDILERRNRIVDKVIVEDLCYILNNLDVHAVLTESKSEVAKSTDKYSLEDKQMLTSGVPVIVIYKEKVYKKSMFKFDFVKMRMEFINVAHTDRSNKEKKRLQVGIKKVDKLDDMKDNEITAIEENFNLYLSKKLKRVLYFNVRFFVDVGNELFIESVVMIFENEYKCKKIKTLIEALKAVN